MILVEVIELTKTDGVWLVFIVWGIIIGIGGCLAHYTIIMPSLKPKDFFGKFLMLILSLHFGITFFRVVNFLMKKYVF